MNTICYPSAEELVAALANKQISAVELLQDTISRIETIDKKVNAVVVRDFERARRRLPGRLHNNQICQVT